MSKIRFTDSNVPENDEGKRKILIQNLPLSLANNKQNYEAGMVERQKSSFNAQQSQRIEDRMFENLNAENNCM